MSDRVESEYYVVRPTHNNQGFVITWEVWSSVYGDCLIGSREVCRGDADQIQAWLTQNNIEDVVTVGIGS